MRKTSLVSLLLVVLLLVLAAPTFAGDTASAADAPTFSDPACVGSLTPRFSLSAPVVNTGVVARQFSSLRTAPGGPAFRYMPHGAEFTVVGGPSCVNNLWYWQLDYGSGIVGWANESQVASQYGSNLYWLEPASIEPPPPPPTCPNSLPNVLNTAGMTGEITQRFSTVRNAPAGTPIRVVYAPDTFTVLGSQCVNGFYWINVDYGDGLIGWALESQKYSIYGNNQYWLEPAGS
ncbi:MAG: hypothetical protein IAE80_01660 [Anaerolinea sp.]|nr:hypothetical protein [Anaerolinea sp.]